jgi:hypothetical protein
MTGRLRMALQDSQWGYNEFAAFGAKGAMRCADIILMPFSLMKNA